MAKLIDLDELLGGIVDVKLGGRVYQLPSDIPIELWLQIADSNEKARNGDLDDVTLRKLLYGQMLALFQVHQPDVTELPVGVRSLLDLIPLIYGTGKREDEEPDPTIPKTRGATSSRPTTSRRKPATKSRS